VSRLEGRPIESLSAQRKKLPRPRVGIQVPWATIMWVDPVSNPFCDRAGSRGPFRPHQAIGRYFACRFLVSKVDRLSRGGQGRVRRDGEH